MQKTKTQVEFDSAEAGKLVKVLKLLENADEAEEAIWFGPSDRIMIRSIRKNIESQTQ